MSKETFLTELELMESDLRLLKNSVAKFKTTVSGQEIRNKTKELCKKWFEKIDCNFLKYGVSEPFRIKYHDLFGQLLKISLRISRKSTYLKIIDEILLHYKDELIAPTMKVPAVGLTQVQVKLPENVSDEEREYLDEAIGCAKNGFYRASIVLGWSAAIHRLHKVVEKLGVDEFNKKSNEMKSIDEGRYKRFKKSFSIHSLSELRATVFDNDLLWVLEYWSLIDSNQHERLSICFTMRNNSAHPGEAPITPENLASFYSDLKNIVFDNPKFKL